MANFKKDTIEDVELPKGSNYYFFVSPQGYRYLYLKLSYEYDSEIQNNKNQSVCVGRVMDNDRLKPNMNYFKYVKPTKLECINNYVKPIGDYILIQKLFETFNLEHHLGKVFGTTMKDWIKAISHFLVLSDDNVMWNSEWFYEDTYKYEELGINSQAISDLFRQITNKDIQEFLFLWKKEFKNEQVIALDSTSFTSYTRNMEIFTYGHSKEQDGLPQINMSLALSQTTNLPIYYEIYDGSINDKISCNKFVNHVSAEFSNVGLYVFDRGYNSALNRKMLSDKGLKYIICQATSEKKMQRIIEENLGFNNKVINYIYNHKVYAIDVVKDSLHYHLFYSEESKNYKFEATLKTIKDITIKLDEGVELTKEEERIYNRYMIIQEPTDNSDDEIKYGVNYQVLDEDILKMGIFAFVTNTDYSSEKIISIYKNRGLIEICFDNIKNELDSRKLKVHNEYSLNGRVFLSFVSAIIRTKIFNVIKQYKTKYDSTNKLDRKTMVNLHGYSPKNILNLLRVIKGTNMYDNRVTLFQSLSKRQRFIYELFDINTNELEENLQKTTC
jgi:transposase